MENISDDKWDFILHVETITDDYEDHEPNEQDLNAILDRLTGITRLRSVLFKSLRNAIALQRDASHADCPSRVRNVCSNQVEH